MNTLFSRMPAVAFLRQPVSQLRGVGPAMLAALQRLLGRNLPEGVVLPRLRELLFHLPSGAVDRRYTPLLNDAETGRIATIVVTVDAHVPPPRGRRGRTPYRVITHDKSGNSLVLVYFSANAKHLAQSLPVGGERVVSGVIEPYEGMWQMTHPDIVAPASELSRVARVEACYPLTYGLSQRYLQKIIQQMAVRLPEVEEWIDPHLLQQHHWPSWKSAFQRIHDPSETQVMEAQHPVRQRLAYDELLANQLALHVVRRRVKQKRGVVVPPSSRYLPALEQALPFRFTEGQRAVLREISADMASDERMVRLLQGDVGSGKTLVALAAMLQVIEAGHQAALMVPTELLARQHYATLKPLLEALGLNTALLVGAMKAPERKAIMQALAEGAVHVVIGTHALFQDPVQFHALGLVVIDEQHRFGVAQRLALSDKGATPHVLLMTATPIPRSLVMTAFGDMDCSALREKPQGRQPIDTRTVPLTRLHEVVDAVERAVNAGEKIYWVCPLIEKPEDADENGDAGPPSKRDLAAAEERFKTLQTRFGKRVALVHGRMKSDQREATMQGFIGDSYAILVATTVIEVGVNVPEATVMVIEQAERFGLAQLHQLRGRVGRGEKPSRCILLYGAPLGEIAKQRLQTLRDSNDGFYIAEEDLRLRGGGEVLGTRQSGTPEFICADLAAHAELLAIARDDAKLILHRDAQLTSSRGQALRQLLYLFDYDAHMRYLESG